MYRNEMNNRESSLVESKSEHQAKRRGMSILPAGKIQNIFELNKRIGKYFEKFFKKIFRDDSFVFDYTKVLTLAAVLSTGIVSESWAAQPNEVVVTCSGSTGYRRTYDETGSYVVLEEKFSSCNNSTKEVSGKTEETIITKTNGTITGEIYTGCTELMCSNFTEKYTEAGTSYGSYSTRTTFNCSTTICTATSFKEHTYYKNFGSEADEDKTYSCSNGQCRVSKYFYIDYDSDYETSCNSITECSSMFRAIVAESVPTRSNVTCPEGCSTCNSKGICVVSTPVLPEGCAEMSGGKCSKAKPGYFINAGGSAEQCASGCNTCSSAEVCTECSSSMFLQANVCVAQCDTSAYYTNGTNCDALPDGCEQVTDDENHSCSRCKNTHLMKDDGSCVTADECNNGFHVSGTNCVTNPEGCNTYADGNCSECNDGYLSNSAGLCTKTEDCSGTNFVDSEAKACKPIPGCNSFADGACSCDKGYYKKDGGCVSESAGCGNGYLGKDGECISSENGCGEGYKDMGSYCNRVRYTPAEAAAIASDDNTNIVTITFKK